MQAQEVLKNAKKYDVDLENIFSLSNANRCVFIGP